MADIIRKQPVNPDAERAFVGTLIVHPDELPSWRTQVSTDDIWTEVPRRAYTGLCALADAGREISPPLLLDVAKLTAQQIADLMSASLMPFNLPELAQVVREDARKRRLIQLARDLALRGYDPETTADEAMSYAENILAQLRSKAAAQWVSNRDLLIQHFEVLEARHEQGGVIGVPTGFKDLDEHLGGLVPGNLVFLAATPKTGKCLKYDAEVVVPESGAVITVEEAYRRRIGYIATIGDDLRQAIRPISAWIDSGIKPVYRVTTRTGRVVEVTETHPFLTINGWRPLSELKSGDYIATAREMPYFGALDLPDYKVKLLAYLIADGSLHGSSPLFTKTDNVLVAEFKECVKAWGGLCITKADHISYRIRQMIVGQTGHGATHNPVADWLRELGLMGLSSSEKFIPSVVFELPRAKMALFLNRLFSCDGYVCPSSRRRAPIIGYASASERLVRQVQHLLLRFGILSTMRPRIMRANGRRYRAYELAIAAIDDVRRFASEIGLLRGGDKLQALLKHSDSVEKKGANKDIIPDARRLIIAAKNASGKTWGDIGESLGLNRPDNAGHLKHTCMRETLQRYADALGDKRLVDLATSDIFWDRITAIEYIGEHQVYDLEVPEVHNFIANDIVVHNTSWALHVALNCGVPCLFFTLEMLPSELADRQLAMKAKVAARKIRTGMMSDDDWRRLSPALGELAEAPVAFVWQSGLTVGDIRAICQHYKQRHGLGLVIIDQLDKIHEPRTPGENDTTRIGRVTRGLKMLARDLEVPVICLAQLLDKAIAQRRVPRPQHGDIRDSSYPDQDADVVLYLWRPTLYWPKSQKYRNMVEIIIARSRATAEGSVWVRWEPEYTLFELLDKGSWPKDTEPEREGDTSNEKPRKVVGGDPSWRGY